jgi:predicted metalloenzyme YecM
MVLGVGKNMAGSSIEQKAIGLLQAFEKAGKSVSRVMIDGRKIELVLEQSKAIDEFDRIDMRHDKT